MCRCATGNDRGQGQAAAVLIRMIRNISRGKNAGPKDWAKDMESSRRFLLQAEIEYWHEMLRLNRDRITEDREREMRNYLKEAVRTLNAGSAPDLRAVA
jgi:hypothetical protein